MLNFIKIIFFLVLCYTFQANAQEEESENVVEEVPSLDEEEYNDEVIQETDSAHLLIMDSIQLRSFDKKQLAALQKDPKLNYEKERPRNFTAWDNFLKWINDVIWGYKETEEQQHIRRYIIYAFCILTIIFVLLRLLKADVISIFGVNAKKAENMDYVSLRENLHLIDFEKLIQEAIQNKDYRQTVRLLYLKALKKLSDKKLIEWQKDKTNHEYLYELPFGDTKTAFQNITSLFEYVCYGDFLIETSEFQQIHTHFTQFFKELGER